ncbi:hypothetical protein PENSPDRAFT_695272 [Peniophora sp. CONT]|nr:hypothetical protein PENSPDRAFT_695272 [Peniophora sp. CONT]
MTESLPEEWENTLLIPGLAAIDSAEEIYNTIQADYQKTNMLLLFATVELRLANCVNYFVDDFSVDGRITSSMRSELNFLRAVLGEVRLASHILPPKSDFLRLLQDCLDRDCWTAVADLRALAASVASARDTVRTLPFPVKEWWLDLARSVRDIPPSWSGFDIADVIIAEGVSIFNDPEETAAFQNSVTALANDVGTLEKDIELSTLSLQALEDELSTRLSETLQDVV